MSGIVVSKMAEFSRLRTEHKARSNASDGAPIASRSDSVKEIIQNYEDVGVICSPLDPTLLFR